jgi:copper chaperone
VESLTYTAPDISCEHCRQTIERTLGALAGVRDVRVEVPSKRVEVTFDPAQVSAARIEAVLDDEGYPVQR